MDQMHNHEELINELNNRLAALEIIEENRVVGITDLDKETAGDE